MAANIKRLLFISFITLLVVPTALAADSNAGKFAVENAMSSALGYLCPASDALNCRTLDFIMSFGLVFFAFWLGLNMVPQFKGSSVWGSDGAQNAALAGISVFAALATSAYVWFNKIPFMAYIAPYGLLIVGLILAITLVSVVFGWRDNTSPGLKILMAGVVLLLVAIFMGGWINTDNGIWVLIGVVAFILIVLGLILMMAGGSFPAGSRFNFNLARHGTPVPPALPATASGQQRVNGGNAAGRQQQAQTIALQSDLKKALINLLKFLKDLGVSINSLDDLHKLITKFGRNTRKQQGYLVLENPKQFKTLFVDKVNTIINKWYISEKLLYAAMREIQKAYPYLKQSPVTWGHINLAYNYCYSLYTELNAASAELRNIQRLSLLNSEKADDLDKLSKPLRKIQHDETRGIPMMLRQTRLLFKHLRELAKIYRF